MPQNVHATTVDIKGAGILITGPSGSGKSDLALRLIQNKNAVLVADDQTILYLENKTLKAHAPQNIQGLLEVRNIGIIHFPYQETSIRLVVELIKEDTIDRLPPPLFFNFENISLPLIKLNAFEASAPDKIVVKLKAVLEEKNFKE